jgi:PAS domain S-box-containing protein
MIRNTNDLQELLEKRRVELEASEARFRHIIERNVDGILIVGRDGVVRFANPSAESLLGRVREELTGEPFGFPMVAGEATELDIVRRGSEPAIVEMRVTEIEWEGEPVYLASLHDVTERKRAVKESQRVAQLNQTLLDSLPHPAMLVRSDRTVLAANRIAREVGTEVGGYCWRDFGHCLFIPPQDRHHVEEHGSPPPGGTRCSFCLADEALATGQAINDPAVSAFERLWDTWWVPIDGDTYLHYAIDITSQREAEETLRHILVGTSLATGERFFEILVRELADWLGVRWALVGELLPCCPERVQPLAFWDTDRLAPVEPYDLTGSPCEQAHRRGFRMMQSDLMRLFPENEMLSDLQARWYAGIPLRNSRGEAVGILCTLHDRPVDPPERIAEVFSIFSQRAGVEIVRKRAEERLLAANARTSNILESISDGFFVLDDDLTVTYFNKAAERLLNRSSDEVLGRRLFDAFPEARGSVFEQRYTQALEDRQRADFETYFEPYDAWFAVRVFPYESGISVYFQVTTERKRTEQVLALQAESDAALAELSRALIAHKSIDDISYLVLEHAKRLTGSQFGYVGYIDPQTGHLISSTMTRDIWEMCHVQEKDVIFQKFGGLWGWVLENRKPILTNLPAGDLRSTGVPEGHIPIDRFLSAPALIGEELVGQVALANPDRDYTERDLDLVQRMASLYALAIQRRRTDEALRESEHRLDQMLQTLVDGMVMVDPDGRITYANPAAEHILELEREAITRRYFSSTEWRQIDDDLQPYPSERLPLAIAMHEQRAVEGMEHGIISPSGRIKWLSVNAAPLVDDNGTLHGAVASFRDITEHREMEAQLEEYAFHLEELVVEKLHELELERAKTLQTAKLAALGAMATGVAHELNQPLTSMLFEADYLRTLAHQAMENGEDEPALEAEELHQIGEDLEGDITRCRRIIDHLRTFGRVSEGHATSVDLNQPIQDSFILIGERLRQRGIRVHLDLAPDLPPVLVDPNRVEQVFLNLISNAEYALEEMSCRFKEELDCPPGWQKELEIKSFIEDGYVVVTVRDSGCGIPAPDQEHIFEPFFTTKPVGEGTGLGLSISYGIVTEYGGDIEFTSEENGGTTFTLRFPVPGEGSS